MENIKITKKYLTFPVNPKRALKRVCFFENGELKFDLEIAIDNISPTFTAYVDVSKMLGKTVAISVAPDMPLIVGETDDLTLENEYGEEYRPEYHFTVKNGWNNDPNGLFKYGGKYHLFYQYNPCSTVWGNMHWGHAVSENLVTFEEKDIFLFPDKHGTAYSGSAFIDRANASGLQNGEHPPILIYYTAAPNNLLAKGEPWKQLIYYSTDGGESFVPYDDNVFIPQFAGGNRDPRVEYCPELSKYIMVLFLDKNDVMFFVSEDLLHWSEYQKVTLSNERECPNIARFKVENTEDEYRWAIYGANGVYFIGIFENGYFKIIQDGVKPYISSIAYAGQDFEDFDTGRRLKIDWHRTSIPESRFSQQMSIPCELRLIKENGVYYLTQNPANELFDYVCKETDLSGKEISFIAPASANLEKNACIIELEADYPENDFIEITVFGRRIILDTKANTAKCENGCVPLSVEKKTIKLCAVIDKCSCELFTDGGKFYAAGFALMDYNLKNITVKSKNGFVPNKLVIKELAK